MSNRSIPQFRSFLEPSDYQAIERVFNDRYIAEGKVGLEFRDKLLDLTGSAYGVLASNGTLALYLALKALNIGPGDEVIVQNTTFIATANAVEMVGAKPVFVDIISPTDPSLDCSKIEITKNTKAVMIAHLYGTACSNTEEVVKFCSANDLLLVEDAAQALGLTNGEKHCGTFGTIGTFSFFADKTITTGEGGFVITADEKINERMMYLRNQGRFQSGTFVHPEIGFNFRLTDIQSALGVAQLAKLDFIVEQKAHLYDRYKKDLEGYVDFLTLNPAFNHIPFRVVVFAENANATMEKMQKQGVEPRTVFYPLHKQPCFSKYNLYDNDFPQANKCYDTGICLPTWIGLSDDEIDYVSECLITAL